MDVFELRDRLIADYERYVRSFVEIADPRIRGHVDAELARGAFWPEARVALNPAFEPGRSIDDLIRDGVLHPECARVFQRKEIQADPATGEQQLTAEPLKLHRHQEEAILAAATGEPYVLTTGTGSGKSLGYIVPIVDHVIRHGTGRGVQAIVVYPMNALANSQEGELVKFLHLGYPEGYSPVTFRRYTGQENDEQRQEIIANPPDILLTNYVMLELILTRVWEKELVSRAKGLRFLVLDELHTYRGRQGADVAMLARRVREACQAPELQCVGTSATLASGGRYEDQRREIAGIAQTMFGAPVAPSQVIGETLRRITPAEDLDSDAFRSRLRERLAQRQVPLTFDEFVRDPLSIWIEGRLGVTEEEGSGRLIRATPRPLSGEGGAIAELAAETGSPEDRCAEAVKRQLLASYDVKHPQTGFPVFAFRLHQFIRRGDTAFVSLEGEGSRYVTLDGQKFVPGDRGRMLFPLVFCRECGQEYLRVRLGGEPGDRSFFPPLGDDLDPENEVNGYLYVSAGLPWPEENEQVCDRLPEEWVEEARGFPRVRSSYRRYLPQPVAVDGLGRESGSADALRAWFVPAPFRFCLQCGVAHHGRQGEFARLATLSAGGRSSATTLLCLEAVRGLREDGTLPDQARKVLTFTDNRQDASLQAGHFNDFVQVGLLRAALWQAAREAGPEGLSHDALPQRVFDQLALPLAAYAIYPDVKYSALQDTERALREVLGYRLYLDLQRGWRLTSPNLEQCGLLEITYDSLEQLCADDAPWHQAHPALAGASPQQREAVCKTLLDHMRRELAIKVDYLEPRHQEAVRQLASQRLRPTWGFDEDERAVHASVLFPRPQRPDDYRGYTYLSARSGFGQYLRRPTTFPQQGPRLRLADTERIIADLFAALRTAGLVEVVRQPSDASDTAGYQLVAASMRWHAGDGSKAFHDPVRVPHQPPGGLRPNPYFIEYYTRGLRFERDMEAREHTAQVPAVQREEREREFGSAQLPLLFCSPTMELGVDIKQLNVVGMRNVPPTPANYAQRSGRAGRSGQPALVFTYCTSGSPHDQYFFKRPERMVAGQVSPPRVDLANEDLLRAHVHSIWLAESGKNLGSSLKEVLDVSGDKASLAVVPSVLDGLRDPRARAVTLERSERVLADVRPLLESAHWWREGWLVDIVHGIEQQFEAACERWRSLFRSARAQMDLQYGIITDASRPARDKDRARRLLNQAQSQQAILLGDVEDGYQTDFYSYRYFASEGFLPGYSFPRLPLSAFIPGRRARAGEDSFLQRARFLAISEFGPRNLLYHEGSRYEINKVLLPVSDADPQATRANLLGSAKRCGSCGYLHPVTDGVGADCCERCGIELDVKLDTLFRLQNVGTRRRDRINCDEEERQRYGYDVRPAVRFEEVRGRPSASTAELRHDDRVVARLSYGQAATIWRINLGWRRRHAGEEGFWIDLETGNWQRAPDANAELEEDETLGPRRQRVVPYVEDHRNCLLIELTTGEPIQVMASLQWALASAMQVVFQLEDDELASEPLPDDGNRRVLLFYEAAEGGAGALRRLIDEPQVFGQVARAALEVCHYDPESGADLRRAPHARDECEAACYDCLLNYRNQRDHRLLDRTVLPELLRQLAASEIVASPVALPRAEQLEYLRERAESSLEEEWLEWLSRTDRRLPDDAQALIARAATKPDFLYRRHGVAIYVDGPVHEYPDRAARDAAQADALEDMGYTVLRFRARDDWDRLATDYPAVFGGGE